MSLSATDLLARLKRGWLYCALGALLGGIMGFAITFLRAPLYEAQTVLAPANSAAQPSGLGALLGSFQALPGLALSLGDTGGMSDRAVAILRSRAFNEKFVEAQGLADVLLQESPWRRWLSGDNATPDARTRVYQAARYFRTNVSAVRVDPRTGFVTIAVRWSDPERVAAWANGLAAAVNQESRERAIAEADKAIEFLSNELLEQKAVAIQAAIGQLIESQMQTKMLANTRPQYVYTVLEEALAPPAGSYVSPNRILTALASTVVGFALVAFVLLRKQPNDGR
jgi:uncharacterized protein involved in exopolysaccharide biosynthesis